MVKYQAEVFPLSNSDGEGLSQASGLLCSAAGRGCFPLLGVASMSHHVLISRVPAGSSCRVSGGRPLTSKKSRTDAQALVKKSTWHWRKKPWMAALIESVPLHYQILFSARPFSAHLASIPFLL
jgi:hypothetical protein